MTGCLPLRLWSSKRCWYCVAVTLNCPRSKVGSTSNTLNLALFVQNFVTFLTYSFVANTTIGSGAEYTSLVNAVSWLFASSLHARINALWGSVVGSILFGLFFKLYAWFIFRGKHPELLTPKIPPTFSKTLFIAILGAFVRSSVLSLLIGLALVSAKLPLDILLPWDNILKSCSLPVNWYSIFEGTNLCSWLSKL